MASTIKVDKIAQSSGTPEFTIPTADGTAGQFLKTDGSGVLAFDTVTTNPLTLTGSTNNTIPTVTAANALTGEANFTYDGNILDIKNSGTASSIKLYCENANAHAQEIKAAPHAGSSAWTLTLPPTVPTVSGQALTATTAGVSSWATVSLAPAFSVCTNAITAITAATNTKIVLDREVFDSGGAFDAATNYRFTVPAGEAGKYFFSGEIAYLITGTIGSTGCNNQIQIHINGTESGTVGHTVTNQANVSSIAMVGSWCVDLAVADYVELWGYISSSGSPTLQYNGNATIFRTHMMGFKLLGI